MFGRFRTWKPTIDTNLEYIKYKGELRDFSHIDRYLKSHWIDLQQLRDLWLPKLLQRYGSPDLSLSDLDNRDEPLQASEGSKLIITQSDLALSQNDVQWIRTAASQTGDRRFAVIGVPSQGAWSLIESYESNNSTRLQYAVDLDWQEVIRDGRSTDSGSGFDQRYVTEDFTERPASGSYFVLGDSGQWAYLYQELNHSARRIYSAAPSIEDLIKPVFSVEDDKF